MMRLKTLIVILAFSLGAAGLVHALSGSIFTDVITNGGCEGAFFDLQAGATSLYITGFETVLVGTANVRVYYKPGTYAGAETNAGAWTLLGSQTIAGGSGFIQTLYPVNVGGVVIPAGETYGFLIYSGFIGTDTLAIRSQEYGAGTISDGVVTLTSGSASWGGDYLNNPFDGYGPINRTWRGKVHYTTDIPVESFAFADGRINRRDPAAAFAIYPHTDATGEPGLVVYDAYAGRLLLAVTAAQIAAVPERPETNILIAASPDGRVSLYRLTDGQFQAMGPGANGRQYVVVFPAISAGIEYRSFEE